MRVLNNLLFSRRPEIPGILPVCGLALVFALAQTIRAQDGTATGTAATGSVAVQTPASFESQAGSWYRIGPGDVLDISVYNRSQLTTTVRVNERGMIGLPLLGDEFPASCRTERELASEIAAAYVKGKFLRNPQVNVLIKDYQASPVAVLGAVNAAGRFQLQRQVRLLELILFAGGPSATASNTVRILHTSEAPPCGPSFADAASAQSVEKNIVTYRLSETMRGSDDANPYVRPGDVVTITDGGSALIMGNVAKPGAIPVSEKTTLSNAIALVGGTLPDTRAEVLIKRQVPGSTNTTDVVANLTAIRKRQANDVLLQPGDIVEVAASTGFGTVMKGLVRSIVPTMTQLPLRVIGPF